MTAALASTLAGCDRFGDHPESFIRVHTGAGEKVSVYAEDGYLMAEGVWTIDGKDKIAAPINLSTITCHRADGYCDVDRVEILNLSGQPYLMKRSDIYRLISWTDNQVRATVQGGCRSHEIRIDIPGKNVVEVTEATPGGSCGSALDIPLDRPRIARMISGEELETMKKDGL